MHCARDIQNSESWQSFLKRFLTSIINESLNIGTTYKKGLGLLVGTWPMAIDDIYFLPKRWLGCSLDPGFIQRRRAGLQTFLRSITEEKQLQSAPELIKFLTDEDFSHNKTKGETATEKMEAETGDQISIVVENNHLKKQKQILLGLLR